MDKKIINSNDELYANQILKKFYDEGLIPAEKKPYLTKLSMGDGPYLAVETKDGDPHYLLDAASQIATLGHGFNPSTFFGTLHHKASWTNNPHDSQFKSLIKAYKAFFSRKMNARDVEINFTNSGAEANELAIGLAYSRRTNKQANKILAFEGSFHGRMLLSLYSTWNPAKREAFQWEGLETNFVQYPELADDKINRVFPTQWKEYWESSAYLSKDSKMPLSWDHSDDSLQNEVESLWSIRKELLNGDIFTILIEPMQCEGGDRYSSDRFHCALALMAKQFGVTIIQDEVQTGFHLGREFFWHQQFNLTDSKGEALHPDYVICAKKAQVGIVIFDAQKDLPSLAYNDQQFQVASVIRGYIHAMGLDQLQSVICHLEDKARTRLDELIKDYSAYITRPRAKGLSFAFEIKDESKVLEFIKHRFEHGLLFYQAGAKTLRFRLNTGFKENDLDFLFNQLRSIMDRIYKGESPKLPEVSSALKNKSQKYSRWNLWHEELLATKLKIQDRNLDKFILQELAHLAESSDQKLELIEIDQSNFKTYKDDILRLENEVYEPARQTDIKYFEETAKHKKSVCYGLKINDSLEAIIFAGPMELYPFERGLRRDPDFGKENSLYMLDTTVHHKYQNYGLGKFLKYILTAKAAQKDISYIKGRNRDRLAAGMLLINLSLGAYEQFYIEEDYPDQAPHRDVVYYTQPLQWQEELEDTGVLSNRLNSSYSINQFDKEYIKDQIPQIVNKVCLSNFVGERFLNELNYISSFIPSERRHVYTTSGQSECVDKMAKSILYKDPKSFKKESYFLTFEGHFFGNGSNLSRSLSQTQFTDTDTSYFNVKRLDHPTKDNATGLLKEIEALSKDPLLKGIWIEPITQKTYQQVDLTFLSQLKTMANKNNIPLIYNETGSQQYALHEDEYFLSNDEKYTPDMTMVFLGGQMGICFLSSEYYISKPLMMISTWDGDQFALSQYCKSMQYLVDNKTTITKKRNDFNQLILSLAPKAKLQNGRGIIPSPMAYSLTKLCRKSCKGHLCDPSDSVMTEFLAQQKGI